MSYKSGPVTLGTSDTDIHEVGATLSAVVVLGINNKSGSARTLTLKYYKHSTATTFTIVSGYTVAANSIAKFPAPFSMESGDKIIGSASSADSIVVTPFITDSAAIPAAQGFTPRGEWGDEITYAANDLVRVEGTPDPYVPGKTYVSLQGGNTNQDPETETAYWMVYVADGPQGEATSGAQLDAANVWSEGQSYDPGTITDNTAWDGTDGAPLRDINVNGSDFDVVNPSNLLPNTLYLFRITFASNHTVNLGTDFKGTGLADYVPSATTGMVDFLWMLSNDAGDELHFVGFENDVGA